MAAPSRTAFTDAWIRRFAASAEATEPELTALDQQVGDGDFGANLVAGLRATLRRLDDPIGPEAWKAASNGAPERVRPPEASCAGPLDAAAAAFLDEVGGTSGPLFGLLFHEMAAALAVSEGGPDAGALAAGVGNGLAAIQRVGEATVGDKTLVDALAPASDALTAQPPGTDPATAVAHAARAAWEGVGNTARLTARRGRASYLGDRAAGVPDPGAVGIALLFSSARGTVSRLGPLLAAAGDVPEEQSA
ncbi:DAK2 domain-containing protein [Streptomyces sp. NPDC088197]|uniref:DAK2 domain-containing protein n=1 Tax=unclassified Streptomyces TaxID=2593676 RepID=UPI0033BAB7F0